MFFRRKRKEKEDKIYAYIWEGYDEEQKDHIRNAGILMGKEDNEIIKKINDFCSIEYPTYKYDYIFVENVTGKVTPELWEKLEKWVKEA